MEKQQSNNKSTDLSEVTCSASRRSRNTDVDEPLLNQNCSNIELK